MKQGFTTIQVHSFAARTTSDAMAVMLRQWCADTGLSDYDIQLRDPALNGSEVETLPPARLLVIEQFQDVPEPIERLEVIARAMPSRTAVIFIMNQPTATDMRRLFHAGAGDVLSSSITQPELYAALNATVSEHGQRQEASSASGRLITVLKSAGGVGATSFCANLARTLCESDAGEVLLVDLDVQFAGLTTCLDLKPRLTLLDAVRADERLDPTLLRSLMGQHPSGFHMLAAPKSMTAADALTPEFLTTFIAQLKSEFDLILFDMPMGWSDWFSEVLSESDLIVPILEPSVRCADGARRILDALEDLGLAALELQPVVNKLERTPAAKERLSGLEKVFSDRSLVTIREDTKAFQKASDLGRCLLDIGGTAAQQDYVYIARRIAHSLELDIDLPGGAHNERRLGLRLFGERA